MAFEYCASLRTVAAFSELQVCFDWAYALHGNRENLHQTLEVYVRNYALQDDGQELFCHRGDGGGEKVPVYA